VQVVEGDAHCAVADPLERHDPDTRAAGDQSLLTTPGPGPCNSAERISPALLWHITALNPSTSLVLFARRHYGLYVYTQEFVMPLNIRNETVNQLAEKLAARARMNKTDAVRMALENELQRLDEAVPLRERLRPLQDRVLSRPATGLEADKAFYDEVSGHK
jgi:antitoxin VapB